MFLKKLKKSKMDVNNILVCIDKKKDEGVANIPFVEDLVIYFVEEKNGSFRIVLNEDLQKLNISLNELFEIAKENVKRRIFSIYKEIPLQENGNAEVFVPFDADIIIQKGMYNFWTSLVLFKEFWNKNSDKCLKNWDRYYIAMPYRTFLIIGNADNPNSKEEILKLVNDYKNTDKENLRAMGDFEAANRSITNDIYIMENGNLKKVITND